MRGSECVQLNIRVRGGEIITRVYRRTNLRDSKQEKTAEWPDLPVRADAMQKVVTYANTRITARTRLLAHTQTRCCNMSQAMA